ncbi:MAG: hypothetical protein M0Z28_29465 [Rhodospirillales bacterium]|nr:hypothetical protein [Rhodospirillales bacterium]
MRAASPRRSWGAGRVAFLAMLDIIRGELRQGYPLTAIFARHQAALGIRYPGFCKLVRRYAEDAKVVNARAPARQLPPLPGPIATPPPPLAPAPQGPHDAGHQPARRTFNHDPIEHPDDRRRLLGED